MYPPFRIVAAGTLLLAVAVLIAPAIHVRAQSTTQPLIVNIRIDGFQPDLSSPFEVQGDFIGTGAWQTLTAPLLGPPFTSITGPSSFTGSCQSEYAQHQIVTSDGSTLIAEVTGIRCVTAPGAHRTFGMYSPVGGTGRFQGITGALVPLPSTPARTALRRSSSRALPPGAGHTDSVPAAAAEDNVIVMPTQIRRLSNPRFAGTFLQRRKRRDPVNSASRVASMIAALNWPATAAFGRRMANPASRSDYEEGDLS